MAQAPVAAPAQAGMVAPAMAQTGDGAPMPAGQEGKGALWQTVIMFGVMILVFWLLIIRPQQKQRKKQEAFLTALKPGDKVITASGFIGRITAFDGDVATVELARDIRVRMIKSQIASQYKDEGESKSS
jgi:preprotein translocase subunit YajC